MIVEEAITQRLPYRVLFEIVASNLGINMPLL